MPTKTPGGIGDGMEVEKSIVEAVSAMAPESPWASIGVLLGGLLLCIIGAVSSARALISWFELSEVSIFGVKLTRRSQSAGGQEALEQVPNEEREQRDGLLPGYYDFEFLKASIHARFGSDVGILVIHYGSTADGSQGNDEDYLVLVHGPRYDERSTKHDEGVEPSDAVRTFATGIDIQVALYDSFWAGLIIGRPFEVSVALGGQLRDRSNISDRYWEWCVILCHNVVCSRQHLLDDIRSDNRELKADFIKAVENRRKVEAVWTAYHICCNLLKRRALPTWDERFPAVASGQLAQYANLVGYIEAEWQQDAFLEVVRLFKANEEPDAWHDFVATVSALIKDLEKDGES